MIYHQPSWSVKQLEQLTKLCASSDRWSSGELAEKLGKSRGSIISMIRRKNIPWLHSKSMAKNPVIRSFPTKKDSGLVNKIKLKPIKTVQPVKKDQPKPPTSYLGSDAIWHGPGIALVSTSIGYGQCRWPQGAKNELCCGKATGGKNAYCQKHMHIAYVRPRVKQSASSEMPVVERVG